jgi:hypothetical protein
LLSHEPENAWLASSLTVLNPENTIYSVNDSSGVPPGQSVKGLRQLSKILMYFFGRFFFEGDNL